MAVVPTRERILDAFESALVDGGERASTLDAVAAGAGVSKGGLLYHFPSKGALVDGLLGRLNALVDEDAERMRTAPQGTVDYFIRTSVASADGLQAALERTIVATACLAQGAHPDARDAIRLMRETWLEVLSEVVADPIVARVIALVSDGLYFNSAFRLTDDTPPPESMDDLVALLTQLIAARQGATG